MKKIVSLLIVSALLVLSFAACSANNSDGTSSNAESRPDSSGKLSIVTTIFPEYDWVRSILGSQTDNVDVTMLLDNGVDLHSFQPTAADIMTISDCDMFVYVGGESDAWIGDALDTAVNKDMIVINLLDVLGDSVKTEELTEGMQAEDEEGESDEEEEEELDEHVWLSLRNAAVVCDAIEAALEQLDPDNAEFYKGNLDTYKQELNSLDEKFCDMTETAARKTLLFGDRFPFRYMTDDYGLDYYAAFAGCSAETEASFETITFLANKVDELELPCVLTIEGTDNKIAETIIQNTNAKNQKILSLNSMQSVTSKDAENDTTYLSVMEENLSVLTEALN